MTLGQLIRQARDSKKVTLRSLAAQLEITPSYLCDIELDRRIPAEGVLIRIADLLKIDRDTLYALSGRVGSETEAYIKKHPKVITLLRTIAAKDLSDTQLKGLINEAEA